MICAGCKHDHPSDVTCDGCGKCFGCSPLCIVSPEFLHEITEWEDALVQKLTPFACRLSLDAVETTVRASLPIWIRAAGEDDDRRLLIPFSIDRVLERLRTHVTRLN